MIKQEFNSETDEIMKLLNFKWNTERNIEKDMTKNVVFCSTIMDKHYKKMPKYVIEKLGDLEFSKNLI